MHYTLKKKKWVVFNPCCENWTEHTLLGSKFYYNPWLGNKTPALGHF